MVKTNACMFLVEKHGEFPLGNLGTNRNFKMTAYTGFLWLTTGANSRLL